MKVYYVTFRSITPAQQAEQMLQHAGISCALQRTPRWMESLGCGYCLRIPYAQGGKAVAVLREGQVAYRRVYVKWEDGTIEEATL